MPTTKTVHTFHPFTRAYAGPLVLDESDLSPLEPGVWLIPGGCLEAAPPTPGAGQFVAEEGGAWVLRDIPAPPPPPPPPPAPEPPTDAQRMQLLDDALEDALDAVARTYGFRNMDRAVSYRGDPDAATNALAEALFLHRSAWWAAAKTVRDQILVGAAPIPTLAEAIAMLPVFVPPGQG